MANVFGDRVSPAIVGTCRGTVRFEILAELAWAKPRWDFNGDRLELGLARGRIVSIVDE